MPLQPINTPNGGYKNKKIAKDSLERHRDSDMDLKLAIAVLALAISIRGDPVPPGGPKYVPVFVSSDALNQLNEKHGQNGNQAIEAGHENISQGPNSDYDIKNEIQHIFNGPPAPVYEHQPDHPPPQPQYLNQNYQNNPLPGQLQYQNNQQLPQIQQSYQANPQPIQIPSYQISQQPSQQYQISQPGQPQQSYQISQQPALQPIVVPQPTASQPMYGNQQILSSQPGQQSVINNQHHMLLNQQQPILFNQQQLQPIQTYQQPNQLLISSPGNQQTVLTQSHQPILINQQAPLPNQQTLLLQQQPIQNGQTLITSNINPIGIGQPNNQVNPGYIQNQNQNVYAMVPVPVNGQNVAPSQNVGTNTYLVPVQQMPNQVYAVNTG